MAEQYKRRRGDRRDGRLLRELDSLHYITGIIYPNRCDNVSHHHRGAYQDHYAAAEAEPLYCQLQLLPTQ